MRLNPSSAVIEHAALGDNTIVAAPAAPARIRVLGYTLVAAGAVTARWKSGAATNKSGPMSLGANGGVSVSVGQGSLFSCAAGQALVLNLGAAVAVAGHVSYVVES